MSEHLLDVHVTKRFGNMTVLNDVRFHVDKNEFLVIVGPTSCGKTTLANIISGIDTAYDGTVQLQGQTVNPKVHNISYVFQEPSCIPWYTMLQDVTMGPIIKGMDPSRAEEIGRRCIKLVDMAGFENYYPRQLSGGMQQRVAIARAYATSPDLLVMDEPFGHLDAQTRYLMQIEIMRIWHEDKKTVVFITNNIEEAVYVGSRILVLSRLPATIKDEHIIDLPYPRDLTDAEFLRIREAITLQCEAVD